MRDLGVRGAAAETAEPSGPGGGAAGLDAGERNLALARGSRLAHVRRQLGFTQRDIAAELGVSEARISQIEHGDVLSFEVIARYVEALGGRLDLVAEFGDRTVHLPVTPPPARPDGWPDGWPGDDAARWRPDAVLAGHGETRETATTRASWGKPVLHPSMKAASRSMP